MNDGLDLRSLTIFVKVAELRSFVQAAKHFSMTQSGISNAIQRLENQVGVPLLIRTTRNVKCSEEGYKFYERCRRILSDLHDAQLMLKSMQTCPSGHIRVTAPVSFGRFKIVPLLGRFQENYPDILVHIDLNDRFVDLVEDEFDVAIRIGALGDSGLIARQLITVHRIVVATPAYIARHGKPRTPAELRDHKCIAHTFQNSRKRRDWHFEKNGSKQIFSPNEWLSISDTAAMATAIASGYGLGQVHDYYVHNQLRDGQLETVLDEFRPVPDNAWILYPQSSHLSIKVRKFIDYMAANITS